MLSQDDVDCLGRIFDKYDEFIRAAALSHPCRPEVLAGIMMRETRGGESKLLVDEYHTPDNPADDTGDRGHGHGLMQIDDRSFPGFCAGEAWKDPRQNILFGALVLEDKRRYISAHTPLQDDVLERASIAAYNCGEGNVVKSFLADEDFDARTTGKNYSRMVLEYATGYRQIRVQTELTTEVEPSPPPNPPQSIDTGVGMHPRSGGLISFLGKLLAGLFSRKTGNHDT